MITYVVTEWCGYFMVIEIDDTRNEIDARIVYGGAAEDSLADCEQWIKDMT